MKGETVKDHIPMNDYFECIDSTNKDFERNRAYSSHIGSIIATLKISIILDDKIESFKKTINKILEKDKQIDKLLSESIELRKPFTRKLVKKVWSSSEDK